MVIEKVVLRSPIMIVGGKQLKIKEVESTTILGRVRWLKPVSPALWEAKAGGSQGQEIETIPVNMVKPRLY